MIKRRTALFPDGRMRSIKALERHPLAAQWANTGLGFPQRVEHTSIKDRSVVMLSP